MKVSVVMPVYNECWTLREIVRRVVRSPAVDELVIVDDGSTDGTRELIGQAVERHKDGKVRIRAILKERNEGKGAALAEGFRAAEGDVLIVQDADLEYDPEDYPQLIEPIRKGRADVVYGSRFLGSERNALLFWHTVANRLLTIFCNLFTNLNLSDVWTGYKAFRGAIVRKIPIESRGFSFEPEITIKLAKLGCRFFEVPIRYQGRTYAEGKKIGLTDAIVSVWRTFMTALTGDLGPLAVGEQTLRIMSRAARYNKFVYDQYRHHLGREVVEIGTGVGNVARFLLDRDRLVLTDTGSEYLEILRRRFEGWENISVKELDVLKPGPEFEPLWGTFDTAVCFNVIEHVSDDAAAVRVIARLLKPGGKAVLIVPSHAWLYGSLDRHLDHFRRYTRETFIPLLEHAGLKPLESRYLNPVAVPGWFINGRIFRRKIIPNFQLSLFDRLTFLVRFCARFSWPFGLSLFAVAEKPR
jgi:glycosyltransferase involved in cell wall biosynthesis